MSAPLAGIGRGFGDPVHASQQVFRILLDAMARPGRAIALPAPALEGIEPPRRIGRGLAALLLTLLDGETTVRLEGTLAGGDTDAFLRFHTGVRDAGDAAFHAFYAADAEPAIWSRLNAGTDEAPLGATLLIEVPSLDDRAPDLVLRGPGIEAMQPLAAGGLARAFWRERAAIEPLFPRGIDLVLVCGERVAAIPRSTRIELQD